MHDARAKREAKLAQARKKAPKIETVQAVLSIYSLTSTMLAVVTGLLLLVLRKNTHTPVSGSAEPSVAITRCIRCLDVVEAATAACASAAGDTSKSLSHLTISVHTWYWRLCLLVVKQYCFPSIWCKQLFKEVQLQHKIATAWYSTRALLYVPGSHPACTPLLCLGPASPSRRQLWTSVCACRLSGCAAVLFVLSLSFDAVSRTLPWWFA